MKSAPYSCRLDKLSSGGDRGPFGAWERPEFVAEPTHKPPKTRAQHFRRLGSPGFSGRLALTLLPQSIAVSLSVDGVSTVCDAQSEFRFGSGPGIRTLNLAVNRSLLPGQKWRSKFTECRRVSPFAAVYRWRCCTKGRAGIAHSMACVCKLELTDRGRVGLRNLVMETPLAMSSDRISTPHGPSN